MYIKQPISFAVTEWPLAPGSQSFIFSTERLTQNTGRLLMHIAKELVAARQPLHSYVPFTLLNIYSPISDTSFGYLDHPNPSLYQRSPLVLTFALTKNKFADRVYPKYVRKPLLTSRIWGPLLHRRNDYLTIKIQQEVLDECNIHNLGFPNLRYLYNVIGMFSKNFVRHSDWYVRSGLHESFDTIRASNQLFSSLNIPISTLVKTKSFPYWAYCATVWNLAPNLIVREHVTDQLLLYYVVFLFNVIPEYGDIVDIFGRDKRLHQFIQTGFIQLLDFLQDPTYVTRPTLLAASILLARAYPQYIDTSDLDGSVRGFLTSVRERLVSNNTLALSNLLRSRANDLSYKLLTNSPSINWSALL